MNTNTEKIKVKRITVQCAEGPSYLCHLKTASNFEEANSLLRAISNDGPDLGYYKTDFVIEFENGDTYEGRFDVYRWDNPDKEPIDLQGHVRRFVQFYAGLRKPDRLTEVQYKTIISRGGGESVAKFREFLEKYEV